MKWIDIIPAGLRRHHREESPVAEEQSMFEIREVEASAVSAHSWPKTQLEYVDPRTVQAGRYQRVINTTRVKSIAKNFDRQRFYLPMCGRREDGAIFVFDGMHRMEAAKACGIELVPVLIMEGTEEQIEASLFSHQNDRVAVPNSTKVIAEALSGDTSAKTIVDTLAKYGLSLSRSGSAASGQVACATVLKAILAKGGMVNLDRTIAFNVAVFGTEGKALAAYMLEASYRWVLAFDDTEYDIREVSAKVKAEGIDSIVNAARRQYLALQGTGSKGTFATWIDLTMLDLYNKRRREANRLPSDRFSLSNVSQRSEGGARTNAYSTTVARSQPCTIPSANGKAVQS